MAIDSGIFQMKTAGQLLDKLIADYRRVGESPGDSAAWFNFIVTADHLPEWELAGDEAAAKRFREQHSLLRVCHHLCINAKHFKARPKKPKPGHLPFDPVASTHTATIVCSDGGPPPRAPAREGEEFFLELSPQEAQELGTPELSALALAGKLVDFWQARQGRRT